MSYLHHGDHGAGWHAIVMDHWFCMHQLMRVCQGAVASAHVPFDTSHASVKSTGPFLHARAQSCHAQSCRCKYTHFKCVWVCRRLLRLPSGPRSLPGTPTQAKAKDGHSPTVAHRHSVDQPSIGPTLQSVLLSLQPGELLGVCGEVGSGKSSLLAALLGELQPLRSVESQGAQGPAAREKAGTDGGAHGSGERDSMGPLVVGSVAYCAQVRRHAG